MFFVFQKHLPECGSGHLLVFIVMTAFVPFTISFSSVLHLYLLYFKIFQFNVFYTIEASIAHAFQKNEKFPET